MNVGKKREADQLMEMILNRATPAELKQLSEIKESRLLSIDSFRALMFKAVLTFIAVSIPMYLSATITGKSKIAFACSLYLAIMGALMLTVTLLKAPRQKGIVFNKFVNYILTVDVRSEFAFEADEIWYETVCEKGWGWSAGLSLLALILAVIFK